jgi:hypothetical protein
MNRNQRIALAERDLQVKDIGNMLNKHSGYITNVLSGRYTPTKLRKEICDILKKPESYLWPEEVK